jgi:hypothetical protein
MGKQPFVEVVGHGSTSRLVAKALLRNERQGVLNADTPDKSDESFRFPGARRVFDAASSGEPDVRAFCSF